MRLLSKGTAQTISMHRKSRKTQNVEIKKSIKKKQSIKSMNLEVI